MVNRYPAWFRNEDNWLGLIIVFIIGSVIGGFALMLIYSSTKDINLNITIAQFYFIGLGIFIFILLFSDLQDYCTVCRKRIFPLFRDHICESDKKNGFDLRQAMQQIKKDSKMLKERLLLNNKKEVEIFEENLLSLRVMEHYNDLKYCMVAMGSILEFLLRKYCIVNNLRCEDYHPPSGSKIDASRKYFVNYVQSAIKNDILFEKSRWKIVQNNLRDFRNYVHINKQVKGEIIDKAWYKTIKPVFERLFESFRDFKD